LFSAKDRQPLVRPEIKSDLYAFMGGIISNLRGKPVLINSPKDHVHLLFVLPATLSFADFVEKLKANSSKWANVARASDWLYN
jgi:REP element-mobilizing transposase RayT